MTFPAYRRYLLDLSTARDKEQIDVSGDYLEFAKVADAIDVRLGGPAAEIITIDKPRVFKFCNVVEKIFVSHSASKGTVEIITTDEFTSTIGQGEADPLELIAIPDGTKRERVGGMLYPRKVQCVIQEIGTPANIQVLVIKNPADSGVLLEVTDVHGNLQTATSILNVAVRDLLDAAVLTAPFIDVFYTDIRFTALTPSAIIGSYDHPAGTFHTTLILGTGLYSAPNQAAAATLGGNVQPSFRRFKEFGLMVPEGKTFYVYSPFQNQTVTATIEYTEHLLDT